MRRVLFFATLCSLASISLAAGQGNQPGANLAAQRLIRPNVRDDGNYRGTVTKVGVGSLTIRGTGLWMIPPHQVPGVMNFPVSELLRKGGVQADLGPANAYRLADVQVGDEIAVEFVSRNGNPEVTRIRIQRRPGGLVPPSPLEKPNAENKYHEWANAYNDWRYKGIPLPEKYDGDYHAAVTLAVAVAELDAYLARSPGLSAAERARHVKLRDQYRVHITEYLARSGRSLPAPLTTSWPAKP